MGRRRLRNHDVRTYRVTSVSAFIRVIERVFPAADDLLFRGQSEDWPLLPKIARITLRPEMDLLATEQSLLGEFKVYAPSFVDLLPQSDWEWLSLAQHYGMATRLLDWTSNPLAALWFAIKKPGEGNRPAVVWVFDPGDGDYVKQTAASSPFAGERTLVFQPKHIARRIIAQSGWFTVHKYIRKRQGFVPLERQARYKPVLTKIKVAPMHFADVRYGLAQYGVNAASLLTDLSGICSHIEWRHSLLGDESDEGKADIRPPVRALRRSRKARGRSN